MNFFSLLLGMFFAILTVSSPLPQKTKARGVMFETYELYSWPGNNGKWMFSLLPTTSRNKDAEEIFDKASTINGTEQLRNRIAKLKRSSCVIWFDKVTSLGVAVKGTEKLKMPSIEIVSEIKRFARQRGIDVQTFEDK